MPNGSASCSLIDLGFSYPRQLVAGKYTIGPLKINITVYATYLTISFEGNKHPKSCPKTKIITIYIKIALTVSVSKIPNQNN